MNSRRGFAIRDLIVVIICLVALGAIAIAMIAWRRSEEGKAMIVEDQVKLQQIHKALATYGNIDKKGRFPRPGLIDRLPVEIDGVKKEVPVTGEEDRSANTTDNLYAALIAQNFFSPRVVVSPLERNPVVHVKSDYNYHAYDPQSDQYWDDTFAANLDYESNTSYAHVVLSGERLENRWRSSFDPTYPLLSNRGPRAGESDPNSYTCDSDGTWSGNVVFGDNGVTRMETMTIDSSTYQRPPAAIPTHDNIFAMETGPGGDDVILSFTLAITEDDVELQHD